MHQTDDFENQLVPEIDGTGHAADEHDARLQQVRRLSHVRQVVFGHASLQVISVQSNTVGNA